MAVSILSASSLAAAAMATATAWLRTSAGLEIQPPLVRACSAARIEHINATQAGAEAPQISAVNARSTRLVTVQMGGNDLGFGNTLIQCYLIICNGPLVTPAELQATQVRLTAMYRQILSTMRSGGTLAVLTYPAIIPRPGEPSCPAIDNFFSAADGLQCIYGKQVTACDPERMIVSVAGRSV